MKFKEAVSKCHVRSGVYRKGDPIRIVDQEYLVYLSDQIHSCKLGDKVEKIYWKNDFTSLEERVPIEDQRYDDWEEYDPRDDDDSSLFMFND